MTDARKMRILLTTDAVGGVWVYSLDLARALAALGVEAVLAVMGPSPTEAQRREAEGIRLVDTGLPLDWAETNAAELGRAGQRLAAIASHESVDLVQVHTAAILAGAEFDQPTVAVQHSCVASWWDAVRGIPLPEDFKWRRDLVATGLRSADAVVAPTEAFAAETARIYRVRHVIPVHNGRRWSPAAAREREEFVLTASRLWDEGKNVATLDEAAAQVPVPFNAAGPTHGPNGASIELEHLELVGQLSAERLADMLAARPVFASAALYEPFGLSVLEAAQAGCALVLSDIATHRELWGEAAVYVSPRDPRGFACAIRDILDDRAVRTKLGNAAQQRARRYTPERMADAMASLYADLLTTAVERTRPLQIAGAA
ncbi:glycosyltransferase involved in cell wall biosynthesis [Sphingomonas sp. F9_3S_D5_B_2]